MAPATSAANQVNTRILTTLKYFQGLQGSSFFGHKMMAKDALWGEMEENSKDDKKIANVAEKKDASERIIVARRNSDEEMESDDEDDVDDKKIANVAEKKDASERIIVARRNSDE